MRLQFLGCSTPAQDARLVREIEKVEGAIMAAGGPGVIMPFELANCEALLLEEIGRPECKRKDVAKTYCLALRSSERDRIDWKKVNEAIIERWSLSALDWIKKAAWSGKCFDAPTD